MIGGVVTVGVGQCGCSVADAMMDHLHQQEGADSYFEALDTTSSSRPRALLVDSEPKAISQCVRRQRAWGYDPLNTHILGQAGAGNNWAAGYSSASTCSSEKVVDALLREAERCDTLDGLIVTSSAAGGTGSGLGAGLTEIFRDHFPRTSIMNAVVCPFLVGEVIVQHYNACLSLSHLLEVSDGVFLVENQNINQMCANMLQIPQPSFTDMNSLIAQHLGAAVLPSNNKQRSTHNFSESIGRLCGHPGYKFFSSSFAPIVPKRSLDFSASSWSALTKEVFHSHVSRGTHEASSGQRADAGASTVNKSIACTLKLHGSGAFDASQQLEEIKLFQQKELYPAWVDDPFYVSSLDTAVTHHRSVTLLSNSQSCVRPIERLSSLGYSMYRSRGYVHQYTANGVSEDDFVSAFAALETVSFGYAAI